jgi:hypothetical protein
VLHSLPHKLGVGWAGQSLGLQPGGGQGWRHSSAYPGRSGACCRAREEHVSSQALSSSCQDHPEPEPEREAGMGGLLPCPLTSGSSGKLLVASQRCCPGRKRAGEAVHSGPNSKKLGMGRLRTLPASNQTLKAEQAVET